MKTMALFALILAGCSSPTIAWNCPDPAKVQFAAIECDGKTRMPTTECFREARLTFCTQSCIANCGAAR